MTKIVMVSDTHRQHHNLDIPKGDVIICAGDITGRGGQSNYLDFIHWYSALPHPFKILIVGNHDIGVEGGKIDIDTMCQNNDIIYLQDESYTIVNGEDVIKVWGSPVTPQFGYGWAFNRSTTIANSMSIEALAKGWEYIGNHWDKIPEDTDILVTHGPPKGILDEVEHFGKIENTGCPVLRKKIESLDSIKLHVFGHIHEGRGIQVMKNPDKIYVNASVLDETYNLYPYKPFVLDWKRVERGKL